MLAAEKEPWFSCSDAPATIRREARPCRRPRLASTSSVWECVYVRAFSRPARPLRCPSLGWWHHSVVGSYVIPHRQWLAEPPLPPPLRLVNLLILLVQDLLNRIYEKAIFLNSAASKSKLQLLAYFFDRLHSVHFSFFVCSLINDVNGF